MNAEPLFDVAHLAHVEMLTPKLEESTQFFVDVMGMVESGRHGDSVYLRGWDDYEHHSLQLTAAPKPGIGHYALRASSPQALQRRVAAIEATGLGLVWQDNNVGHGPAFCYTGPDHHRYQRPNLARSADQHQSPAHRGSYQHIRACRNASTGGNSHCGSNPCNCGNAERQRAWPAYCVYAGDACAGWADRT